MNGATHYPDLSHLYGSSQQKLSSLRAADALLKTFNDYGRELPPLTKRKECMTVKEGAACFESGLFESGVQKCKCVAYIKFRFHLKQDCIIDGLMSLHNADG